MQYHGPNTKKCSMHETIFHTIERNLKFRELCKSVMVYLSVVWLCFIYHFASRSIPFGCLFATVAREIWNIWYIIIEFWDFFAVPLTMKMWFRLEFTAWWNLNNWIVSIYLSRGIKYVCHCWAQLPLNFFSQSKKVRVSKNQLNWSHRSLLEVELTANQR